MLDVNDPRLTAYVLGELSSSEMQEVKTAIEKSSELQKAVEEIERSVDFLKSGFADELKTEGLVASVPRVKLASAVSKTDFRKRIRWLFAGAASLLFATMGYFFVKSEMANSHQNYKTKVARNTNEIESLPDSQFGPASLVEEFVQYDSSKEATAPNEESLLRGIDVQTKILDIIDVKEIRKSERSLGSAQIFANESKGNEQPGILVRNPAYSDIQGMDVLGRFNVMGGNGKEGSSKDGSGKEGMGGGGMGGNGPGMGGDRYEPIIENDFLRPTSDPLSTFSIDVDTASYSKVRSYLMNYNQLPPAGAVRIEELVNYFPYNYAAPTDDAPFAAHQSIAICPWNPEHKLVRVALKGKEIKQDKRPVSNLVFLLDVSGSMNESQKLPLVKRGIKMLIDQLTENDRVAMVVYAGAAGTVLDSTTGDQKSVILGALDRLQAGGSTNGGEGIRLAYKLALDHFITGGVNRVILCTDGDFNVGTTSNDELVKLVEEQARQNIFLSVLGFGMGNLNDSMLEQVSNRGNGNYAFIDTDAEARKVLVEQMTGTLITIAKDVKIQIEFNPARVEAYRLIGYENRVMAAQDFNNDKKDAGEIGAGHSVTALYEIVPAGKKVEGAGQVDGLKYQPVQPKSDEAANASDEILTLKLRYKEPEGDTSKLLTFPLVDSDRPFADADQDFQFAAAVASFGMQLRQSKWAGKCSLDAVLEIAESASKSDKTGYRTEFLQMVRSARELMKK